MSAAPPVPTRRRVKKRILIPVILLGLVMLLLGWLYVRGTWASTEARSPKTSAQAPITQLYRTPEGNVQVRSAVLIDAPADKVWAAVRDYDSHPRFLPYISEMKAAPEKDGRVSLSGTAHSRVWGDWPLILHMDHRKVSDKEYLASWDDPSDTMPVNRGSWTVRAVEPGQTLVVLALQVETARYPNFFVRNLLLDRLGAVLAGLRDEMKQRQAGK